MRKGKRRKPRWGIIFIHLAPSCPKLTLAHQSLTPPQAKTPPIDSGHYASFSSHNLSGTISIIPTIKQLRPAIPTLSTLHNQGPPLQREKGYSVHCNYASDLMHKPRAKLNYQPISTFLVIKLRAV